MKKLKRVWTVLKSGLVEWNKNDALELAAAISYYTVFSVAPLLLLVLAISGLVFGEEAVRGEVFGQLRGLMGSDTAKAVEDIIANAQKPKSGVIATIVGIIVLLIGASAVFSQLKASLNKIWKVAPQKTQGVWGMIRGRLLSFAMVLSIGFLLLVSLTINAAFSAASKYFSGFLPDSLPWLEVGYTVISIGLIALLFALIFRVLPEKQVPWKHIWPGAFLTSLLFAIGKHAIGLYLGRSSVASAFGASASVVIIMVWAYYSACIFLYGASVVKSLDTSQK